MKVIDLLNKIANEEEVPKKIKYKGIVREFDYEDKDYTCIGNKNYYLFHDILAAGTGDKMITELNDEVEVIEDTPEENKKIEKLDLSDWWGITSSEDCKPEMLANIFNKNAKAFSRKINEIIDYISNQE